MRTLDDKVFIVTGGSSGIGRAAARAFADPGARVIVTGRRAAPLDEAAAEHPNIAALLADVAEPGDAARTVAAAVGDQGRERIPLKRRGDPHDVARWIVSLAGPAGEWVTGQVFAIDGGLGLA